MWGRRITLQHGAAATAVAGGVLDAPAEALLITPVRSYGIDQVSLKYRNVMTMWLAMAPSSPSLVTTELGLRRGAAVIHRTLAVQV
jgi:hypothetical protein